MLASSAVIAQEVPFVLQDGCASYVDAAAIQGLQHAVVGAGAKHIAQLVCLRQHIKSSSLLCLGQIMLMVTSP